MYGTSRTYMKVSNLIDIPGYSCKSCLVPSCRYNKLKTLGLNMFIKFTRTPKLDFSS